MEAHLERHRKSSYIHRLASRMLHEWRGRHPCDGGAEHVLAALSIKIFRNKCEKYLNAPMTLLIIQNTHIKIQKYLQILSLCYVSFKVKKVIVVYIKIQKSQNTLIHLHNNFILTLRANM